MDSGARLTAVGVRLCRLGAQRTLLAFITLVCMVAVWSGEVKGGACKRAN
jgi:hypothetical protein